MEQNKSMTTLLGGRSVLHADDDDADVLNDISQ